MAEFVDLRMQEIAPVLKELQSISIVDKKEIRSITKEFRSHECKMQSNEPPLDTMLEYIAFESTIIKKIKKLRKEKCNYLKTKEIDQKLIQRVESQLGTAKLRFSDDLKFWKAHIDFHYELKAWKAVSSSYLEVLNLHGLAHPHMYTKAWNFEYNLDPCVGISAARTLYQNSFRKHPENLELKIEAFTLELRYNDYLRKDGNQKNPETGLSLASGSKVVNNVEIARIIYNFATESETKAEKFLQFYLAAQPFLFTKNLQQEIIMEIQQKCETNEETYDYLAKLSLKEKDYPGVIQKYELGLKSVKTKKMFDSYLKTLWLLISKGSFDCVTTALENFEQAHYEKLLSLAGYCLWARVVQFITMKGFQGYEAKDIRTVDDIIELGTQTYEDEDPWILNAEHIKLLLKSDVDTMKIYSKLSLMKIPSISFWKDVFITLLLRGTKRRDLKTFVETVAGEDVRGSLRTQFVTQLALTNMKKARKYYLKIHQLPPFSLELHEAMISFEQIHLIAPNYQAIRDCYETATSQFGEHRPDLWIKFMHFEKFITRDELACSQVKARAVSQLDTSKYEEFLVAAVKEFE